MDHLRHRTVHDKGVVMRTLYIGNELTTVLDVDPRTGSRIERTTRGAKSLPQNSRDDVDLTVALLYMR